MIDFSLYLGQVTFLIEFLESFCSSMSNIASLDESEKKNLKKLVAITNNIEDEESLNNEMDIDEIAKNYELAYETLTALKKIKQEQTDYFLRILFPYANFSSEEIKEHPDSQKTIDKINFIKDFLNSPKTKHTSRTEFEGNLLLYGYKNKEQQRIYVYECKDWVRHEFGLNIPKGEINNIDI